MSLISMMASRSLAGLAAPPLVPCSLKTNGRVSSQKSGNIGGLSIGRTSSLHRDSDEKIKRAAIQTFATSSSSNGGPEAEKQDLAKKEGNGLSQRQPSGRGVMSRALSPFDMVFPASRSLRSLLDVVDQVFDDPYYAPSGVSRLLRDVVPSSTAIRSPWDIIEEDGTYYVRVDMPGFSKEEVKVFVEEGELVIKGERNLEDKSDKFARRNSSNVSSRLLLPDNVELEGVKAELKNGVLLVTVPKKTKKNGVLDVQVN